MPSTASHSTRRTERSGTGPAWPGRLGGLLGRGAAQLGGRPMFARRTALLPGPVLAARPGLLVLTTLLLVGLCTLLAFWGALSRPEDSGFNLPAENSSSKLDNTSAEAPANVAVPPPQPKV